jgi:hypothetical protein
VSLSKGYLIDELGESSRWEQDRGDFSGVDRLSWRRSFRVLIIGFQGMTFSRFNGVIVDFSENQFKIRGFQEGGP